MSKKTRQTHKRHTKIHRLHKKYVTHKRHTRRHLYKKNREIVTLPGSKGLPLFS